MRGFYVGATVVWFQPIAPRGARTQAWTCLRPFLLRGVDAGLQHARTRIGKRSDRSPSRTYPLLNGPGRHGVPECRSGQR
ncbi:MAG: hypothetical protein OXG71_10150, partial [Rhodospirillales bacterium]|nr:hypothetical protein [Rhodospirillales bacterium]